MCANGVSKARLSALSKIREAEGHLHEDRSHNRLPEQLSSCVPTLETMIICMPMSHGRVWGRQEAVDPPQLQESFWVALGDTFCVSSTPVTSVTSFLLLLCCCCNAEEKDEVCV